MKENRKGHLNIPEPERYPRMTPEEINFIKKMIPEGHRNVVVAFHSDVRNFKEFYPDCIVVLTPFILYCYKPGKKKAIFELQIGRA